MTLPPRGPGGGKFTTPDGSPTWVTIAVDAAVRKYFTDNKTYGSMLTKEWLCNALAVVDPETTNSKEAYKEANWRWWQAFDGFSKEMLTKHNVALANVRGNGYRVVNPQEQAKWAATEGLDDVKSALSKMSARIKHTNMSVLNPAERAEHDRVQDHSQMIKRWVETNAAKPVRKWSF